MKFLIKSCVITVRAETVSSVLPEGAVDAASETESLTVISVDAFSTVSVMGMSRLDPELTCPPERVVSEKPGAETTTE
jgi:hypothetical protein